MKEKPLAKKIFEGKHLICILHFSTTGKENRTALSCVQEFYLQHSAYTFFSKTGILFHFGHNCLQLFPVNQYQLMFDPAMQLTAFGVQSYRVETLGVLFVLFAALVLSEILLVELSTY